MKYIWTIGIIFTMIVFPMMAQGDGTNPIMKDGNNINFGKFSGNFQLDAQYYNSDAGLGTDGQEERILSNGYFNLNYTNGNFRAGIRYENYANPLSGFDPRFAGSGFPYKYIQYSTDFIEVTAGNFYEQFGNGLVFRSYEERQLGIDNAVEGVKVKLYPTEGIVFTGLIGRQRNFWDLGDGMIRGLDAEMEVNSVFPELLGDVVRLNFGASFLSKYQDDLNPELKLPNNVMASSFRFNLTGESFMLGSEFAYKPNDPSSMNNKTYNPGTALLVQGSYFDDGIGISLNLHRVDNFDFRGDRDAKGSVMNLNYIPPISKQHSYGLFSMYPYSTQLNGEVGLQANIDYTFSKESFLGGKYPFAVSINYSRIQSIDTTQTDEFKYDSPFFSVGDKLFFQDVNLYISKKLSSGVKANLAIGYETYDRDLLEKEGEPHFGKVNLLNIAADVTFKLAAKHALRIEVQHQSYSQDSSYYDKNYINGNMVSALAEYTIAPKWYFTIFDEYNYGNEFEDKQLHYVSASIAFIYESSRIQFGYGRQREGILCVGGVCRQVPAASGFNLSISTSF